MKVVLVGQNNPLSVQPRHALFPYPPGCTGWRIWQMLVSRLPEVTRQQYLDGFERTNLVRGPWTSAAGRAAALRLPSTYAGRTILLLGEAVRSSVGLEKVLVHPVEWQGCTWRQLPHPSGRNRWYNVDANVALAATLLEELYMEGKK